MKLVHRSEGIVRISFVADDPDAEEHRLFGGTYLSIVAILQTISSPCAIRAWLLARPVVPMPLNEAK